MKKLSSTPVLLLIALSIGLMSFSFQRKVKNLEGYDIKKLSLRYDSLLLLPGSVYGITEPHVRMGFGRENFAANLAVLDAWLRDEV